MSQPLRFAFVGFRHGHIFDLLAGIQANPETTVVAACEEDPAARKALESRQDLKITHDHFDKMLAEVECDIVAIGDYYTKRGPLAIKALQAGKHVVSDKPLCCTLDELARIKEISGKKNLAVTSQFDLRGAGTFLAARTLICAGEIGQVHTISFGGQHPLLLGSRPGWYFEPGCHGGTINDIAIHAMDAIPWLTGRNITDIVAARAWNAKTPQYPHFQDSAQIMLRLDNGGGVLGDLSYLAPDACGFGLPQYWRFLIHGSLGMIEFAYGSKKVMIATHTDKDPRFIEAPENIRWPYLADFLAQVHGKNDPVSLSTGLVLQASHLALQAQQAADRRA
jgi:predicted dehydrogenase